MKNWSVMREIVFVYGKRLTINPRLVFSSMLEGEKLSADDEALNSYSLASAVAMRSGIYWLKMATRRGIVRPFFSPSKDVAEN
jgi:hypothetical protein